MKLRILEKGDGFTKSFQLQILKWLFPLPFEYWDDVCEPFSTLELAQEYATNYAKPNYEIIHDFPQKTTGSHQLPDKYLINAKLKFDHKSLSDGYCYLSEYLSNMHNKVYIQTRDLTGAQIFEKENLVQVILVHGDMQFNTKVSAEILLIKPEVIYDLIYDEAYIYFNKLKK